MRGQTTIILVITLVGVSLSGCSSSERVVVRGQSQETADRGNPKWIGMPNPAAVKVLLNNFKIV